MSADSHNACPNCYHLATGVPIAEITQVGHLNKADKAGVDEEDLAEYHENYIDKGHVVFEYHGAKCDTCGYQIPAFIIKHPLRTEDV